MISFESFKTEKGTPVYLQIIAFIKRGAAGGTIMDGDELPSRRALSVLLGINPNTVQRAFSMLEEEGLIASSHGITSVMTLNDETVQRLKAELMTVEVKKFASFMKQGGLSLDQAEGLLEDVWEEA